MGSEGTTGELSGNLQDMFMIGENCDVRCELRSKARSLSCANNELKFINSVKKVNVCVCMCLCACMSVNVCHGLWLVDFPTVAF